MIRSFPTGTVPDQAPDPRLGEIVRSRRQELGWNQLELCQRTGISPAVLNRIESGQTSQPSPSKLARLAEVLDLDLGELFTAVGLPGASELLPSFEPYLRAKYGNLPPEARAQLAEYFDTVHRRFGDGSHSGPQDGEDETPPSQPLDSS